MEISKTYKLVVMYSNGIKMTHNLKEPPVINNGIITVKFTPFSETHYIIANLYYYSITTILHKHDAVKSEEQSNES